MSSAELLFEEAACGLLLTTPDGLIQRVNRTFCRWIGYEPEELVGVRRIQDLMNMGGKIFHQTHWSPLMQMQGSVAEVKLDLINRDGTLQPFLLNGARREQAGNVVHDLAVFMARDRHKYEKELLAARKRAEELLAQQLEVQRALGLAEARLRVALDAAQLYVWEVDISSGERQYDANIAVLLGMEEPTAISAAAYSAQIHPDDRLREEEAFQDALGRGATFRCVYRISCVDGAERTVLATGSGRYDGDGTLLWYIGVIQDITELSRQRAAAEDRATFAEQMVGIVSHDLRNPLTSIKMGAELLDKQAVDSRQRRLIDHISTATSRAQRMVDDLLDFTLIRLGRGLRIKPQRLDPGLLIAANVSELRLVFAQTRLVHQHYGMGECEIDPDRTFQILSNLVSNAVTYGDPSGAITVISALDVGMLTLTVHNSGDPVPVDLLPRLFEPMVRGTGAQDTTRSVGLGLFIVREIARAHGGEVEVCSTSETGTQFSVVFPISARC